MSANVTRKSSIPNRALFRLAAAAALTLIAGGTNALAQFGTGPNEVEGNDSKAGANASQGTWSLPSSIGTTNGVIVGNSVSATGAGLDYYHLHTPAQPSLGIYLNRLTMATAGYTGTIRGLSQVGTASAPWEPAHNVGTPGTTDFQIQIARPSNGNLPTQYTQWYTFGRPADIYYSMSGTATTTANYSVNYTLSTVTPVTGPSNLAAGSITITTVGLALNDTDMWVYDSAFNAIAGYGNDDTGGAGASRSTLTRTYAPGTYYLAVSAWNLANNQCSPSDDNFRTAAIMDFPDVLVGGTSTAMGSGNTVSIGGTVLQVSPSFFEAGFVRFTVLPSPTSAALLGLGALAAAKRRRR